MHTCGNIKVNNSVQFFMVSLNYQLDIKIRKLINEVTYFCTYHLTVEFNHLSEDWVFMYKGMYLVINRHTDWNQTESKL